MQLTLWTYEGPTHVGAMRIATAMKGVHYVLHAPQGDTYADLLFTMIERRDRRPPVTYTTFQARDLGGDTAELFKNAARNAYERFQPQAMLVGASCTAELIQDDPAGLAAALNLPVPVVALELPSYQRKENWGAAETFYRIVRTLCPATPAAPAASTASREGRAPRCNILGPAALGFRHRDDLHEIRGLIERLGIAVNVVAPLDASPADITRLADADFNVVLYPEIANTAAQWLQRTHKQPFTKTIPIGVAATRDFIAEVCGLAGIEAPQPEACRATWYSRSVDATYLTGKRVFVFGDATHAVAAARMATQELGFTVVGLGTYSREFAREIREAAAIYGVEPLISDDYLEVEAKVAELQPELVLGTQMERHIAKRQGIPCAVISAPVHVQDFPARYSPQMGYEGANVIFDTWVQPLMMGLEEHLLHMFRDDFEFHPDAAASHLGQAPGQAQARAASTSTSSVRTAVGAASTSTSSVRTAVGAASTSTSSVRTAVGATSTSTSSVRTAVGATSTSTSSVRTDSGSEPIRTGWAAEAERELHKIPFFVRGKARRNTESYARERGVATITVETLYDAKAHFSR